MESTRRAALVLLAAGVLRARAAWGQVIEFENNGLRYLTMTRNGLTIMFAHLPSNVRGYSVIQASVTNGSPRAWLVKPEDFRFERSDGTVIYAAAARAVVTEMVDRAGRNDVIRLIATYETGLYGMTRMRSTNGYEERRQSALAELGNTRLKAAAAASAIAFVETKLGPGQSTDGAIFYPTLGRPLGAGRLIVRAAGETFSFDTDSVTSTPKTLQQR
ncbi:MAG TPA: hypothetical protein DEH78_20565 [Solibacterales bacterium]|nr:hypothetical protein [Bryobacterales bacterium]